MENCKKYGVPFYGASFVPRNVIGLLLSSSEKEAKVEEDDQQVVAGDKPNYVIFSGGGGEGRSGIPNALVISLFDPASDSLSDQPVSKFGTDDDLPYRMAVHPGGEGVICSLPKSCRWFEWETTKIENKLTLTLKQSEKVLYDLEHIGQQLAVTFNHDGSLLALGSEDGKLRAFKWPTMESLVDVPDAHTSIKNLDFSPDGKFLVSVGSGGPGRVWDLSSSTLKASLPKENDEVFGFCRFSQNLVNDQVLYITAMRDRGGSIVKWNTTTWKRISSKHIVRDPISAFDVSDDGKFLAIGTIQGDIYILNASMKVHTVVKKAHLGLVTALAFSRDSRALVSASLDSSARVTQIKETKKSGLNIWIILFIMLLAAVLYYAKTEGLLL
ncbi:SEC12-like protein 2 [Bidens hawaiensis]|uniref:SEC12-like protein 2 n=1 Tax=Bidens hawaiensis TaxID=980011 RepID=UPI004049C375